MFTFLKSLKEGRGGNFVLVASTSHFSQRRTEAWSSTGFIGENLCLDKTAEVF